MDVDRKFKGQHGMVLSLKEWRKLVNAVGYIDEQIAAMKGRRQRNASTSNDEDGSIFCGTNRKD